MKSIRKPMEQRHRELTRSIDRAFQLYAQTCEGAKWMIAGGLRGPRAPDKWDVAQMLFFEVAAEWEAFCTAAFEAEVKQRYRLSRPTAMHIMSDIDRDQVSGYGSPKKLVERSTAMLSKTSPLATFATKMPQAYERLLHAYKIRNFIAHAGEGEGREGFKSVLNAFNVPPAQRMGISAGKFLPVQRVNGIALFDVLLRNYKDVADYVLARTR